MSRVVVIFIFLSALQPLRASAGPAEKGIRALSEGGRGLFQQAGDGVCIPEETQSFIQENIYEFEQAFGPRSESSAGIGLGPKYPFYPQGGTLYQDLTTGNFVDLNPQAGVVENYLCEDYGNDGHNGIDTGGLTWEEMAIGQPVYAALDGVVLDARDGDPDMNTSCESGGNWVIIDHGDGREAWYFHLKRNSVAVNVNDSVVAGQQIGLVGSSGCSFSPHLHFESRQNLAVVETFSGPCRLGESLWENQVDPPEGGAFVRDMGVTTQDIGQAPPLPFRAPVDNQIPLSAGGNIFYWLQLGNLPANSEWFERYVRPDGMTEFELGPFPFENQTVFQVAQYWFPRFIGGMANTTGTWRIHFEVNGELLVDAPVEVVDQVSPTFNRPPEPISVSFDPPNVRPGQVIFARVAPAPLGKGYRDLDWDILRYRYVWKVNGTVVRDVISVGMADALAANHVTRCKTIEVTVTAGDGVGGGLGETAQPLTLLTKVLPEIEGPPCREVTCRSDNTPVTGPQVMIGQEQSGTEQAQVIQCNPPVQLKQHPTFSTHE